VSSDFGEWLQPRWLAGQAEGGGGRGARVFSGEEYLSEEQRRRRGCIARRTQPDVHHGLL